MPLQNLKPTTRSNDDKRRMIQTFRTIGRRVEEARKKKGLTQSALADLCDLSQPLIAKIERGENELRLKTLLKLAVGLNCSLETLVREI